jgi:transcription initiation factor IIE alpha subunit
MKKVLFAVTVVAALGFSVISCKSEAKKETEENKTEVLKEDQSNPGSIEVEEIETTTYHCPMKCEEGKTYDAPGKCPVCKMDLKETKSDAKKKHLKDDEGKVENDLKEAGRDVKKGFKKADGDVKKEFEKLKGDVEKKKNKESK